MLSWIKNNIKNKTIFLLLFCLIIIAVLAHIVLPMSVSVDTVTYLESMSVLKTDVVPDGFVPNRILTNYLGMWIIMFLGGLFGNIFISWKIVNYIFFVVGSIFFYLLIKNFYGGNEDSTRTRNTAIICTLFFAGNYAMLAFGLNYLMDTGGWAFYILSLYFSFKYILSGENIYLYIGSLMVGLGLFFKEYAALGYIVILGAILYKNHGIYRRTFKEVIISGTISFLPIIFLHIKVYFDYDYSYFSWFQFAESKYGGAHYTNRPIEYLKAFGSLYNFGWFLFIGGAYYIIRYGRQFFDNRRLGFLIFVLCSALPAFVWSAITQRILFITVPFLIIVSSVFVWRSTKKIYLLFFLVCYIFASYTMDAYILPIVNIDLIIENLISLIT